ncbi:MAG: ABC transporter ATP-binding protein [Stygiobacter sp.]|uniref:ABC transporter ATP-binding protein n=1 Tax=Stygiobacter electus TaxID=3032292 RepID=A0AAE3P0S5_9BACT|nr:ABC transporter ATP-binding protein [Stygiobacter electus]MDF1612284.1 ABC transporter ATP-binding protein [Stygiobacter electus]
MSLIQLINVTKEYKTGSETIRAVNNISLNIEEGSFVTLMGESGSGKSTLLTMLGGLNKPTGGNILIDQIDIYKLTPNALSDFRKEYVGFVFQAFQLVPYLTVEENVMLPLAISDQKRKQKKEIVFSILEKVRIKDKSLRLINELSGGEQQRVAIARALVYDPLIILADEPTGNLDSNTSKEIINIFLSIVSEGKTVVMVTHNKEYTKHSTRVIELSDGKIIKENCTLFSSVSDAVSIDKKIITMI